MTDADDRDVADDPAGIAAAKAALRATVLAARRAMPDATRVAARAAIRDAVLRRCEASGWTCVAAYEPWRSEPGSPELLRGLVDRGIRVLVPLTLPSGELDWAEWTTQGRGTSVGLAGVGAADAVLVPALAVGRDGSRLGRGRGCYDRALRRARPQAVLTALVFDGELLASVPVESWDVRMSAAVTPAGWTQWGNTGDASDD